MTLMIGLLLLVGAGILSFSAARTSVVEQRIANNEFRAKEAQQAAQAGLEYALAWLMENRWTTADPEPTPPILTAASGYRYQTRLSFAKDPNGIRARAQSSPISDPGISASAWECFNQAGLFDAAPTTGMPAPLVLAGCMSTPTGTSELLLLADDARSVMTGAAANAACLPQGAFDISTWHDDNHNRIQEPDEEGPSAAYKRASFRGCPASDCAWKQVFAMGLDAAKTAAADAGHLYTESIPCGATEPPGIYLVQTGGPISSLDITGSCAGEDGIDDSTIGTPDRPILLIVPSDSGCPSFDAGISIHGILYYESPTACATRGWGGASIHGAVIWEGDAGQPEAGSRFIATDYGDGGELNDAFQVILGATRIPGTWRDWD